jgi:hypothetical protein
MQLLILTVLTEFLIDLVEDLIMLWEADQPLDQACDPALCARNSPAHWLSRLVRRITASRLPLWAAMLSSLLGSARIDGSAAASGSDLRSATATERAGKAIALMHLGIKILFHVIVTSSTSIWPPTRSPETTH